MNSNNIVSLLSVSVTLKCFQGGNLQRVANIRPESYIYFRIRRSSGDGEDF